MRQGLNVAKKSGLYLIGNLSSKFVNVLLIPIYAFALSADALGTYDYVQTIVNFILPFAFVAVWEAVLRFCLRDQEHFDIYIKNVLSLMLISVFLIVVVAIIYIFCSEEHENIIIFLNGVTMLVATGAVNIWQYAARGTGQNITYVISSVLGTITNVFLNIILLCVFRWEYNALFFAYNVSHLLVVCYIEFKLKLLRRVFFSRASWIDSHYIRIILNYSAPLMLNLSLAWFFSGFGRILVANTLGSEQNGLFSFAMKFATLVTTIGSVVGMAIIEEGILISGQTDREKTKFFFSHTLEQILGFFLSMITCAMPAISIFYTWIAETEYRDSFIIIPFVLIYGVMMSVATSTGAVFQAADRTKYQFVSSAIGTIVLVITAWFGILAFGIVGAAIGQMVGATVLFFSRYLWAKRLIGMKIRWRRPIALFVLYVSYCFLVGIGGPFFDCLLLLLGLAGVLVIYRDFLKSIFKGEEKI